MTRRLIALLAVTVALGACNAHTPAAPSRYTSLDATLDARSDAVSGTQRVPVQTATPVVVLPAWMGRPTGLRERDDADAFQQAITFGSRPRHAAGDNAVLVGWPRTGEAVSGRMGKPTEDGIRAEMEVAFPGTTMQVGTRPAANTYGPYGLAIGRDPAGLRCLYAWQWIAEPPASATGGTVGPMSLRVRLCRADMTLEAMAAAVNQLRLVPRFAGTPVAEDRGVGGTRIAAARPVAEPRRRTRRDRSVAKRPEPETRRILAASAPSAAAPYAAAPVAALSPASPPDSSGRRYLGSEAPAAAPASGSMPGALAGLGAGVAAPASGVISADLPPEATRGPVAPTVR